MLRAGRAWRELSDALSEGRLPPLAWAIEWSPDGTLETLWQASPDWACKEVMMYRCHDFSRRYRLAICRTCPWCLARRFFRRHRHQLHRYQNRPAVSEGEYIRRTFLAPTLEELRRDHKALAMMFELPF